MSEQIRECLYRAHFLNIITFKNNQIDFFLLALWLKPKEKMFYKHMHYTKQRTLLKSDFQECIRLMP